MDIPVRTALLQSIKELMVESDWHIIDRYSVEKANLKEPEGTQKHLDSMVYEYEHSLKDKISKLLRNPTSEN